MDNEEIYKILKSFIKRIQNFIRLDCVILFGSRARNDYTSSSDIDLIFIGDFKEKFIDRSLIIFEYFDFKSLKLGIDAFCYTPGEFGKMFYEGSVSILDAIDHGICIFGNEFFKDYEEKLQYLKCKGLRRDPPVWILPKDMSLI